jgi:hypothetical protein
MNSLFRINEVGLVVPCLPMRSVISFTSFLSHIVFNIDCHHPHFQVYKPISNIFYKYAGDGVVTRRETYVAEHLAR